jgi:hypothetical protein
MERHLAQVVDVVPTMGIWDSGRGRVGEKPSDHDNWSVGGEFA